MAKDQASIPLTFQSGLLCIGSSWPMDSMPIICWSRLTPYLYQWLLLEGIHLCALSSHCDVNQHTSHGDNLEICFNAYSWSRVFWIKCTHSVERTKNLHPSGPWKWKKYPHSPLTLGYWYGINFGKQPLPQHWERNWNTCFQVEGKCWDCECWMCDREWYNSLQYNMATGEKKPNTNIIWKCL